jgi:hypothetical protein
MMEMPAGVKFKHRRKAVERKFQPRCLGTSKRFTNLSVVLDTQHEHGQRPGAENLLLFLLPKRRQQAQDKNCVS